MSRARQALAKFALKLSRCQLYSGRIQGKRMDRRNIFGALAATASALMLLPGSAMSQEKPLKKQLVGTWNLVSAETVRADGSRFPTFGQNPRGIVFFDGAGNYALQFMSATLPRFSSNNRTTGSAEENKAVVTGSIAHFGTYTVNEADKTFTVYVASSTFPNWTALARHDPSPFQVKS